MFKITIISVGNMKEKYFAEAIKEYEKRISAYAEVRDINLKEENLDNLREGDIAAALEKEGKAIIDVIPSRAYKVGIRRKARRARHLGKGHAGRNLLYHRLVAWSFAKSQSRVRLPPVGIRTHLSPQTDESNFDRSNIQSIINRQRRKVSQVILASP